MERARAIVWLIALGLCVGSLGLAPEARAVTVVDYDTGELEDFRQQPYAEDGTLTEVTTGHYEIVADAGGADGDQALNVDEENFGLSEVRLRVEPLRFFDAVSLEVVNPAESAGEYTISALGGGGGSIGAPTQAGTLALGPGFQGIWGLVITQNAPGAFAVDDVTIEVLPEPGTTASLLAGALALLALRRRAR